MLVFTKICRCVSYLATIFLMTIGVCISALAAYLLVNEFPKATDEFLMYLRWSLVAVGPSMLIGGLLGCLGVLKKSDKLLSIFIAIMAIILVAVLEGGWLLYIFQGEVFNFLKTEIKKLVYNGYGIDEYITQGWDYLQREFTCCGAARFANYISPESGSRFMVPKICCPPDQSEALCEKYRRTFSNAGIDLYLNHSLVYDNGCADMFTDWMKSYVLYAVGVLTVIGFILIICLIFIFLLMIRTPLSPGNKAKK